MFTVVVENRQCLGEYGRCAAVNWLAVACVEKSEAGRVVLDAIMELRQLFM